STCYQFLDLSVQIQPSDFLTEQQQTMAKRKKSPGPESAQDQQKRQKSSSGLQDGNLTRSHEEASTVQTQMQGSSRTPRTSDGSASMTTAFQTPTTPTQFSSLNQPSRHDSSIAAAEAARLLNLRQSSQPAKNGNRKSGSTLFGPKRKKPATGQGPQTDREKRDATQGSRSSCADPEPIWRERDKDDEDDGYGGAPQKTGYRIGMQAIAKMEKSWE
ncbi:MAG: hypothetical protein Q9215_006316, partial [Flavoplaca cf. flavocitrina]